MTLDELKELLQKNKVQLEGELDPDTVIGTRSEEHTSELQSL